MNPFLLPAMDWIVPIQFFYKDSFDIKWSKKVVILLKKNKAKKLSS